MKISKAIKGFLGSFDARDVHIYLGTAMLGTGLGFFIWQLALIVPGIIFLYIALRRINIGHS